MQWFFLLGVGAIVLSAWVIVKAVRDERARQRKIVAQIQALAGNTLEMTPEEFLAMRNGKSGFGQGKYALRHNFAGVYILFNKTQNKYYVGQGQQILNRVNAHFTGHGNGDVYADYKYGHAFTIRMIGLAGSGFASLNELERETIRTYDSYMTGYNRTRGNRG